MEVSPQQALRVSKELYKVLLRKSLECDRASWIKAHAKPSELRVFFGKDVWYKPNSIDQPDFRSSIRPIFKQMMNDPDHRNLEMGFETLRTLNRLLKYTKKDETAKYVLSPPTPKPTTTPAELASKTEIKTGTVLIEHPNADFPLLAPRVVFIITNPNSDIYGVVLAPKRRGSTPIRKERGSKRKPMMVRASNRSKSTASGDGADSFPFHYGHEIPAGGRKELDNTGIYMRPTMEGAKGASNTPLETIKWSTVDQLKDEMEKGRWFVVNLPKPFIFDLVKTNADIYAEISKKLGGDYEKFPRVAKEVRKWIMGYVSISPMGFSQLGY